MSRAPQPRAFVVAALLLLAGWALFFFPILAGRVPVFRDILHTTLPMGAYIGARLREGSLPQWFPFEGLGEPFIGQLNESTFHPASWLFALFAPATALRWNLLLAYLAAGAGMLLYARALGLSAAAAATAAVIFCISGYPVSLSNLLPYLWGLASLPWVGLCTVRALSSERPWAWTVALALAWASSVVAGDSHSALLNGLVVLFTCAVQARWRRLWTGVTAGLLALALCAAELLPAIDLVRAGPRAAWTNLRALSSYWALHPYRWPELLLPNWLPGETGSYFAFTRFQEANQWSLSVYVGVPAVLLALCALGSRQRLGRRAVALALLGLWLALGVHGGLEPLVRRVVPVLNFLRYPEKVLSLFTLGLALAAAAGLDRLRERRAAWLLPALLCGAAACALAAAMLPRTAPLQLWPQLDAMPNRAALIEAAWRASLWAAAAAQAGLALVLLLSRRRAAALALVPVALFLELWSAHGGTIAVGPAEALTALPRFCASALEAGAGPAGLRALNVASRPPAYRGLDSAVAWVVLARNMLSPDASWLCGIGSVGSGPTLSNEPRALRALLGETKQELNPALPLYGFGLVVRSHPQDSVPGERVLDGVVGPEGAYALVQRPAAPRAFAAVPRWVPDDAAAVAAVRSGGMALVQTPVLTGTGPQLEGEGSAGAVRIVRYEPERVVLEANLARAGAIVLNDLFAAGWTATLDGAPAQIFPANAFARGVLAPSGAHVVELRYALPRLRAGLVVSSLALLGSALVLGAALLRRRPRAAATGSTDEAALQREYWANADRSHFLWQTKNPYIAATEVALLDRVEARAGESFLEIGCGEGANLRHLAPRLQGARVFAIDFSASKAAFVAREGARAACADAARLPFHDGAFDAVLVRDLLHHVPDRAATLREAARVLKPGGRLTVIEPNGRNPLIAAMALAIRAERGMLASRPAVILEGARAAGVSGLACEARQPLPLSRAFLHYQHGAPSLARFALVRTLLGWLERSFSLLPRSLWSYFIITGTRR